MELDNHGGGCCGIMHISGFPWKEPSKNDIKELKDLVNEVTVNNFGCECILVEVVLSHAQLKFWEKPLKKIGFKLVTVFRNVNSDNLCHIFHLYTEPTIDEDGS